MITHSQTRKAHLPERVDHIEFTNDQQNAATNPNHLRHYHAVNAAESQFDHAFAIFKVDNSA